MTSSHRLHPSHPSLTPPGDPYLDYGPALPERHGLRRVVAIARDPETVWAWWEIDGASQVSLRDVERGVLAVLPVDGPAGSVYFHAAPDRTYVVEIGPLTSNRVKTPRRGPTTEIDPDWAPTPEEAEILKSLPGHVSVPGRPGYVTSSRP